MRITVKVGDKELAFDATGRRIAEQGEVLDLGAASDADGTQALACSDEPAGVEVVLRDDAPSWHVALTPEQVERLRGGEPVELEVAGTRLTVSARGGGRRRSPVRSDAAAGGTQAVSTQAGAVAGGVYPPMPGTVVQVGVAAGQEVDAGAVLLILEAMKMQNEVRAPAAGRVASLHVEAGTKVDKGTLLLVVDPL